MSTDPLITRPATPSDAPAIARLHAASWRATYRGMLSDAYLDGDIVGERTAYWQARLDSPEPHQHVIVLSQGPELVGFACALGAAEPPWGTLVENLHVAASHKRQGLGARLLAAMAQWTLSAHPGLPMHLWVLDANTPAQRFYEAMGAVNVESALWSPPDGTSVPHSRFVWHAPDVLITRGT
jgi:GNAT superfamily N-acetyltransferase